MKRDKWSAYKSCIGWQGWHRLRWFLTLAPRTERAMSSASISSLHLCRDAGGQEWEIIPPRADHRADIPAQAVRRKTRSLQSR